LKENVRKLFYLFFDLIIIIAYSSQSKRKNFINEIIEEEDEDKNKEKEKKERKKNGRGKRLNENIYPEEKIAKPVLIWSNSQFNTKTYENIIYKKTYDEYVPIHEKLINDKRKSEPKGILTDFQMQSYNTRDIKTLMTSKNNMRSKSIDKKISQINTKANLNNNINSTNDTSDFTHSSKKYSSPRVIYTQNYTEDLSKFRMGLLSAGYSCNNNIIIPMMPFRRPVSNFNFGAGQLWNNFEKGNTNNNKENTEEKNEIKENKENDNDNNENNNKKNYFIYDKVSSATRNNKPFRHTEMKKRLELFQSKKDINNLYIGMDKMITKLHKIKIEKGMMNSGIVNSLNKKFNRDYQNQIEQFKKSHLPMMFDNQNGKGTNINNNVDKNRLRSHSFNNRNNFY
jgi:hypothetical protein